MKFKNCDLYFLKYAYTKVLQGSIDLASVVFPPNVYGRELDVEARGSLWRAGLDYGHGTGFLENL